MNILPCQSLAEGFSGIAQNSYSSALVKDHGRRAKHYLQNNRKVERQIQLKLQENLHSVRGGAVNNRISKQYVLVWNKALFRELLAEMIGTFLIVHLGTGAVMTAVFTDSLVGLFQIASVWIIAVTIAICTTASIS
jgi:hypothetical protein